MIRTLATLGAAAAIVACAPSTSSISPATYTAPVAAAAAASSCTPLILRYFNIDKRIVDGPGGPSDPETFVAAGVHFRRGCHIISGRATLSLQFRYREPDGYHYRTIPRSSISGDLRGEAHTLFNLLLPSDRQPNCTGTNGLYRIKLNLSPGEVIFEGKRYHIQPTIEYFPAGDHGQEGKRLDCRNASS